MVDHLLKDTSDGIINRVHTELFGGHMFGSTRSTVKSQHYQTVQLQLCHLNALQTFILTVLIDIE